MIKKEFQLLYDAVFSPPDKVVHGPLGWSGQLRFLARCFRHAVQGVGVRGDVAQDRDVAASCEIATGLKCGNRITENGR